MATVATESRHLEPERIEPLDALAERIDEMTRESTRRNEVVEFLVSLSLPAKPWEPAEFGDPFRAGGIESLAWPWNRAANNYLDQKDTSSAIAVWSAHYLALLSLQVRLGQRYHKAMAICNIGYAWAIDKNDQLSAKAWLLGVAEDALTKQYAASEGVSYKNLVNIGVVPRVLDLMIWTITRRYFIELSGSHPIVPMFPEEVMDLWLDMKRIHRSEKYDRANQKLKAELASSYPKLPNMNSPWETLNDFWSFANWEEGILVDE